LASASSSSAALNAPSRRARDRSRLSIANVHGSVGSPKALTWEFLRPFAGPHSVLCSTGRSVCASGGLIQTSFQGERMNAFRPIVAELARRE